LDTDLKIILLSHQNIECFSIDDNTAKNFDVLAIGLSSYITSMVVQTNYLQILYLTKFLDISAKPFFLYDTN